MQGPVGFCDTVGFTFGGSAEDFEHRRQAILKRVSELQHCCVAVLATMSHIPPEVTSKLPGHLSSSTGR